MVAIAAVAAVVGESPLVADSSTQWPMLAVRGSRSATAAAHAGATSYECAQRRAAPSATTAATTTRSWPAAGAHGAATSCM